MMMTNMMVGRTTVILLQSIILLNMMASPTRMKSMMILMTTMPLAYAIPSSQRKQRKVQNNMNQMNQIMTSAPSFRPTTAAPVTVSPTSSAPTGAPSTTSSPTTTPSTSSTPTDTPTPTASPTSRPSTSSTPTDAPSTTASPTSTSTSMTCAERDAFQGGQPIKIVIMGNSFTLGQHAGKVCSELTTADRPDCQLHSNPGNVRAVFRGDAYPNPIYDHFPKAGFHPGTKPHRGDVPSKMKRLVEYVLCGTTTSTSNYTTNTLEYVQNTQSAVTTTIHAGLSTTNVQRGTLFWLQGEGDVENGILPFHYNVVLIQPSSTEYLSGVTNNVIAAYETLTTPQPWWSNMTSPPRIIVQQTWPERESARYNHVCTTNEKKGFLEEINVTLAALATSVTMTFQVAPTGNAFLEFAKLACGPQILPPNACALDDTVDCPIWFGPANNFKFSLYSEQVAELGQHQSEEIGAWVSAAVMTGMMLANPNKSIPCYLTEADLQQVMPIYDLDKEVATIPTGLSLSYLIAESARRALVNMYQDVANGVILEPCVSV